MKICKNCYIKKEDNEFYKDSRNNNNLQTWCIFCKNNRTYGCDIPPELKKCPKCNLYKLKTMFGKSNATADKLMGHCLICRKEICKRYKTNNKEKIKLQTRQRYERKREEILEYSKKNYRDKIEYYNNYHKEYRARPEVKKKKSDWIKQKYKDNLSYRIHAIFAASMRQSIKDKNRISCFDLVHYSLEQLKEHLQSQFESWMNWDNWGRYDPNRKTWNIDHIIPVSSFSFDSYLDGNFKKCWSLDNLRPLETIENLKKGNRLITMNGGKR